VAAGSAPTAPLASWSPIQGAALTSATVRSRHRLGDLPEFSDDALVALLDRHPRELVQAYSPGAIGEGSLPAVDLGTASGAAILETLGGDLLWMVIRVDSVDPGFGAIQDTLMSELAAVVPDLLPGTGSSNLLVSSPGAGVPFHLDTPPGILWHVRGRKRVWVYPALNEALVPHEMLEDLYAGVHREFVQYEPSFDDAAIVYDLEPGDVISWPQNSPHRIDAREQLNVSLATEFRTRRSERRARLYRANRFLHRQAHLPVRSTAEVGTMARIKRGVYAASRRTGLVKAGELPQIEAPLRLNADEARVEHLAAPVPASFS